MARQVRILMSAGAIQLEEITQKNGNFIMIGYFLRNPSDLATQKDFDNLAEARAAFDRLVGQ